jgi:hypothetical protein
MDVIRVEAEPVAHDLYRNIIKDVSVDRPK